MTNKTKLETLKIMILEKIANVAVILMALQILGLLLYILVLCPQAFK